MFTGEELESVPPSAQTGVHHSLEGSAVEINSVMPCLLLSSELCHYAGLHLPNPCGEQSIQQQLMERVPFNSYWFIHGWSRAYLEAQFKNHPSRSGKESFGWVKLMKPINSELCILEECNERSLQF